jgi:hypothetical protein
VRGFEACNHPALPLDDVDQEFMTYAQPAFRATAFDHEDYQQRLVDHYYPYSLGEAQKDVTRASD